MNSETETYEQFESRRRQEIQDEQIAKNEANKILNKERQLARFGRFGINRELPRSQEALAVIAAEETRVLGVVVEPPLNIIKEAPKNDAVDDLIDDQCSYVDVENQSKIDENSVVIGNKLLDSENSIEQLIHANFDLLDTSIQSGTHLSVTEIITKCGLPVNKANSNVVAALLKNTGHNYCKSKGQRGYWITIRA